MMLQNWYLEQKAYMLTNALALATRGFFGIPQGTLDGQRFDSGCQICHIRDEDGQYLDYVDWSTEYL